jgi:uroporphyrinogen-III synthase
VTGQLAGCRVVVCRAAHQSERLLGLLRDAGADAVPLPLVAVGPPVDGGAALAASVDQLGRYDWVLFTSANAVHAVAGALAGRRWPDGVQVGSVGPATTEAAEAAGIPVAVRRPAGTGGDLAAEIPPPGPAGGAALLPAAEVARPELAAGLRRSGWDVEVVVAYRSTVPPLDPSRLDEAAACDAVLFTAPSTVDRLVDAVGPRRVPPLVVCIGPSTAERAGERGLGVAAVADVQSDAGLVAALGSVWPGGRGGPTA